MTGLFPDAVPNARAAIRDLSSARSRVRRAAAEALGDVSEPDLIPDAVSALIRAAEDLSADVRAAAVASLGELGGDEARDTLEQCLGDGNSHVRQVSAVGLGTIGSSASFPALLRALQDGPADLRFQAATSLAEVDGESARAPLRAALDDEDAEVVGAAAVALGALGEKSAANRIADLIANHGPKTGFELAYALADLGDDRAVETLTAFVSDSSYGWDAIAGLEKIGNTAATSALRSALHTKRIQPTLRIRAAAAILVCSQAAAGAEQSDASDDPNGGESSVTESKNVLIEGLAFRRLDVRGLAIQSLAQVGGDWAIDPLERLLSRRRGRRFRDEIGHALQQIRERQP